MLYGNKCQSILHYVIGVNIKIGISEMTITRFDISETNRELSRLWRHRKSPKILYSRCLKRFESMFYGCAHSMVIELCCCLCPYASYDIIKMWIKIILSKICISWFYLITAYTDGCTEISRALKNERETKWFPPPGKMWIYRA